MPTAKGFECQLNAFSSASRPGESAVARAKMACREGRLLSNRGNVDAGCGWSRPRVTFADLARNSYQVCNNYLQEPPFVSAGPAEQESS